MAWCRATDAAATTDTASMLIAAYCQRTGMSDLTASRIFFSPAGP